MKEFYLKVVTPDGVAFEGMVESLMVPTTEGGVEFLAGHIDYIASIGIGKARIKIAGKDRFASVSGGFVSIDNGKANLIATTFEFAEDIDLERARIALENAKHTVSSSKDSKAIDIAKLKIQRALSRINVAEHK